MDFFWKILVHSNFRSAGIYIYILYMYLSSTLYRIQESRGHLLRRHSNPTRNPQNPQKRTKKKVLPENLILGQVAGLMWTGENPVLEQVFYGFRPVLIGSRRFLSGLWRSCFIKNLVLLTQTLFFFFSAEIGS